MAENDTTGEARLAVQGMAQQIRRLQRLGFADPEEENALGHSGGGGTCCQSGVSHGCTIHTGADKIASPTGPAQG